MYISGGGGGVVFKQVLLTKLLGWGLKSDVQLMSDQSNLCAAAANRVSVHRPFVPDIFLVFNSRSSSELIRRKFKCFQ